ncbi:UDP-N-acetylglucosamine 2-epimerase [Vibrio breoganii]
MSQDNVTSKYRFILYVEQNYSFDILRPIYDLASKLGHDVRWLLVGSDASSHLLKLSEKRLDSIIEAKNFSADAVFVPGDRVPSFLSGLKVQVFHGLNESKRGNIYPERGMFDLYCTEGPERTSTLSRLAERKKYFKVIETGWVKLDTLFSHRDKITRKEKPTIFFASTFSPSLSCAEFIYDEIAKLSNEGDWEWIVTLHPKMDKKTVKKYQLLESDELSFIDNENVIEAMHVSDVMVCDNSSIFQEFLLLNKPVVTVNNREPQPSFINITKPCELKNAIYDALNPSTELKESIEEYGLSITPYLDGHSAQRIINATIGMINSGWKDKKPINIIRNFKIRKSLNFWKI